MVRCWGHLRFSDLQSLSQKSRGTSGQSAVRLGHSHVDAWPLRVPCARSTHTGQPLTALRRSSSRGWEPQAPPRSGTPSQSWSRESGAPGPSGGHEGQGSRALGPVSPQGMTPGPRSLLLPAAVCTTHMYVSVQSSRSVVSDSLGPHGLQHAMPPCPSPTPGVYSNSGPLSR